MKSKDAFDLTSKLITFRSVTGTEREVLDYLSAYFTDLGWRAEKVPGDESRYSILVSFGKPEIIFSTHVDVVPAEDFQFIPEIRGEELYGRGACDAKGILASMIAVVDELVQSGENNFGLLVVFEEETTGFGAKQAAKHLQGRGIEYLINGEPTTGKIALGHKGVVAFDANFSGIKAHSGYPELGDDANLKMIEAARRLYAADFGSDSVLGPATLNIGKIDAGVATNVISDRAHFRAMVRSVNEHAQVEEQVQDRSGYVR